MNANTADWWRGAALYQVYPLSFADSNGDGWGDLPGINARLEYIASLGVDGIWLSPFYASPLQDFGYDTVNQKTVGPLFGTLGDFDALLKRAHELSLKVIIDQVYTYTSDQHPWFLQSRSQPEGEHGDWYLWAKAKTDGTPPNNWQSLFGGPAWEWSPFRRQYYMTHFLPGMPHLRAQNPAVQEALLDIGRFWLDRGVDGFRLDVINLAMVDDELRDNPTSGLEDLPMPIWAQEMDHDGSLPENFEFVRRIRLLADEQPGRFLLGEVTAPDFLAAAREYSTGTERLHSAYFVLGADAGGALTAASLHRDLTAWNDETSWPTWAFSNHDILRGPTRCGGPDAPPELAQLLLAVLACMRGTILIYQGDELGLPNADLAYEDLRDPATRRYFPLYMQRDGARSPMPWHAKRTHAGFSTTKPWLPLGSMYPQLAVDAQEAAEGSTLKLSRELLALRKQHSCLRTGKATFHDMAEPLLSLERRDANGSIGCIFNISNQPQKVKIPFSIRNEPILVRGFNQEDDAHCSLDPYGFGLFLVV